MVVYLNAQVVFSDGDMLLNVHSITNFPMYKKVLSDKRDAYFEEYGTNVSIKMIVAKVE